MKTLLALIVLTVAAHAQGAKVIELSPEEAQTAKKLHDEQDAIAKKIAAFDQAIKIKYLTAPKEEEGHTNTYSLGGSWIWVRSGWGTGEFEYSEDWRFIVPLKNSINTAPSYCLYSAGCIQSGSIIVPMGTLSVK